MADAEDVAGRPSYEQLAARVVAQEAVIVELRAMIAALEARLVANSRNPSRPPSSDGLSKPAVDPKRSSLRRSSGRRRGGQEGHEGARLESVAAPDERVEHLPERCEGCGGDLAGAERLEGGERRQVFDLPPGTLLRVVEHVAERRCWGCGHVSVGAFPAGVGAPTQYGPGIRALGVYLCVFQHLPYDRAARALRDLAGAAVSTGALSVWVAQAAAGLTDFDERLRELLIAAEVAHFDETGARIAGRLGWVHSASTNTLTRYTSTPVEAARRSTRPACCPAWAASPSTTAGRPTATTSDAITACATSPSARASGGRRGRPRLAGGDELPAAGHQGPR